MAASLSSAERRILEATEEARATTPSGAQLTVTVRRMLGHLPGPEFRRSVARLAERGLLRAHVSTKVDGDVGRVVIEEITPLGRSVVRAAGVRHPLSLVGGTDPVGSTSAQR